LVNSLNRTFFFKILFCSPSIVHLNNVIVRMYVNCFDKHEEPQKTETKERVCVCVYWRIFPSRSIDFYQLKIWPRKALVKMTQTNILSTDVLSPRTFCPHGCFVCRTFCPTDLLSPRTFFVATDVLSPRTFCPHGPFVHGRFVSGRFVSRRFVWAPWKTWTVLYTALALPSFLCCNRKI
jgi:hypothetical protein